jgi:CBS domain containing-hemolysin-like protein
MTDALAVPETSAASALLPKLRKVHTPMAILIEEYGGTAGQVTSVDLVESLVGDITEDFGAVSPNVLRVARIRVLASSRRSAFEEAFSGSAA